MIVVQYQNGGYAPLLLCDTCGNPIKDLWTAVAVNGRKKTGETEWFEIAHTHKGKCHIAAEEKLGGRLETGWDELSTHLAHLIYNVGTTPREFADRDDLGKTVGEL